VVCSGVDIDAGLVAKAAAAATAATVATRCSFTTGDALALAAPDGLLDGGSAGTSPGPSVQEEGEGEVGSAAWAQRWAVVRAAEAALWPGAETRPISVVVAPTPTAET
jgi:hypothetical protein